MYLAGLGLKRDSLKKKSLVRAGLFFFIFLVVSGFVVPTAYGQYTSPPTQPSLISPPDKGKLDENIPIFEWEAAENVENYRILVAEKESFSSPLENTLLDDSKTEFTGLELEDDFTYYWKVVAINSIGKNESSVREFTVDTGSPNVPTLESPENNSWISDNAVLSWDYEETVEYTPVSYRIYFNDGQGNNIATELISDTEKELIDLIHDGLWYWWVRAIDAAGNRSEKTETWTFHLDSTPPPVPELGFPSDGVISDNLTTTFGWENIEETEKSPPITFKIQMDNDLDFSSPENEYSWIEDNSYSATIPTGIWYWRVRSKDNLGNRSEWSENRKLIVDRVAPPSPSLSEPENMFCDNLSSQSFSWESLDSIENSGPVEYHIQIDDDSNFSSPEKENYWRAETSFSTDLPSGFWYWRVRARDGAGNVGDWSPVKQLRIDMVSPRPPELEVPEDGTVDNNLTQTFEWENLDGYENSSPVSYQIQISTDRSFEEIENEFSLGKNSYSYDLEGFDNYYWRVRARDNAGNTGRWSEPSLVIIPVPPRARFSYTPKDPIVYERITFHGSPSVPGTYPIESYIWDFGGEEPYYGKTLPYRYEVPGDYSVTLTVRGSEVSKDSVTKIVTVRKIPDDEVIVEDSYDLYQYVNPGEPRTVRFGSTDIVEMVVNVNSRLEPGLFRVREIRWKPHEMASPPGFGYKTFQVTLENSNKAAIENIRFKFRVSENWISKENARISSIRLHRYDFRAENWNTLPTSKLKEEGHWVYFTSTSPGLSMFSVTGSERVEKSIPWLLIVAGVAVAVLAALIGIYFWRRRSPSKEVRLEEAGRSTEREKEIIEEFLESDREVARVRGKNPENIMSSLEDTIEEMGESKRVGASVEDGEVHLEKKIEERIKLVESFVDSGREEAKVSGSLPPEEIYESMNDAVSYLGEEDKIEVFKKDDEVYIRKKSSS